MLQISFLLRLNRRIVIRRNSYFSNIALESKSSVAFPDISTKSKSQIDTINEVFKSRLLEKCQNHLLTRQQLSQEELRINLSLLDLNSFLQSTISSTSAQRQGQLSALSTTLQQTLDTVRDGLSDLKGEIQTTGNVSFHGTRQQRLEGELQRREGILGVALGEFRTRCEGVKLRAIYFFTMGISGLFLAIVIESSRKRSNRLAKEREKITEKQREEY